MIRINLVTSGSLLLVVLVVLAGACAQVLMKVGLNAASMRYPTSTLPSDPLLFIGRLVHTPAIWAALFLYAAGLVVWMVALSRLPLSFAYSFQALTYLLVPLGSMWLLGEAISLTRWSGIVIICLGIVIVAISR